MRSDLGALPEFAGADHPVAHGMLLAAMSRVFLPCLRLMVVCAAVSTVAACDSVGVDTQNQCTGAKCDDPNANPTPHGLAVAECDKLHSEALGSAGASAAELLVVENAYLECLVSIDDAAVVTIEDNLTRPERERSVDEIFTVFDEFRYASLCVDLQSASSLLGDEQDLLVAQCEVTRERSLAQAIGALVDFSGQRASWELGDERATFEDCYNQYDDALSEVLTPSQTYLAQERLVTCTATDLRAQSELIKNARCELEGCGDELLALSFIQAGFETAIVTTDRACDLLVDASIYREQGDPSRVVECQISLYAQLKLAVLDGLGQ